MDLGLCQRRKHFHGQLIFQCITIPDNFFNMSKDDFVGETNKTILSSPTGCFKVAEGSCYDDLVSTTYQSLVFCPPGDFGLALFNHYMTAPIPMVRFINNRKMLFDLIVWACKL